MSKGYNNFMSKKGFHPGSFANQKKVQEAEARAEAKRKHEEETLAKYQKEQELLNQKSLVSKESKEKLSLSFMYEAPAGVEKQSDKGDSFVSEKGTRERNEPATLEWKRDRPARPVRTKRIKKEQ